jgi:imidazole glycerol-phosphate synthase subunit HisH
MQLLYDSSEESASPCLGVLPGAVARLPQDDAVRVPHMGWNRLDDVADHAVLGGLGTGDWFYFVHAYAAPVNNATLACSRNGERFAAAAGKGNFVAVQFHPERSSHAGARVLRNFLAWAGCS